MSELRWILVGFGIVLLAGIYLWGRRGGGAAQDAQAAVMPRTEPPLQARESPDARASMAAVDPDPAPSGAEAPGDETLPPDYAQHYAQHYARRARVEPTFSDSTPTEELPVQPAPAAPTLSSSEAPQPRRIERRKILALRLSIAPERLEGATLLETLEGESLEHGKYDVFHRLHSDGASIFSVASMVEPGTFDLEKMPATLYPGITLFAQLPGPVPGMHALNELVACARRLQQALGGTLQDDRGVPLTVHRIERLRQEVREFERPAGSGAVRGGAASPASP